MKTDLFQSCGHCWVFQVCWHIDCSTFTASSFRIWDSSSGIPSPPLGDSSKYISRNFSGAVAGSEGSVQFQIVPCSSLNLFSRSIGPIQCLVSVNYRVLICYTCHFQSGSLVFVYFGFLCKSLQCLISALTPGGKGGHSFTLTCSVVLWGGQNIENKYHWCVWGVLVVYGPHCVCAAHSVFWVYTAQAPGCSAGALSKAGPAFCALPRSKLLRFRFSGLGWACVLCPSRVRAAQATRCLVSAVSQAGCAS